jgi:hypothetical protein
MFIPKNCPKQGSGWPLTKYLIFVPFTRLYKLVDTPQEIFNFIVDVKEILNFNGCRHGGK